MGKLTWREALETCEVDGGSLASIRTKEELFQITKQVTNRQSHFWIGSTKKWNARKSKSL